MTKSAVMQRAYVFDGSGGAREIQLSEVAEQSQLVWVQLAPKAVAGFIQAMDLPSMVHALLTNEATRLRILLDDQEFVATFRGLHFIKNSLEVRAKAVQFWRHQRMVVTVQSMTLPILEEISQALIAGVGPKSDAELLEHLLMGLTEETATVMSTLVNRLDEFEEQLESPHPPLRSPYLNDIRQQLIVARRYLRPQREIMRHLLEERPKWISKKQFIHLRAVIDSHVRLLEDVEMAYEQAGVLKDELISRAQDSMNRKIYLLTMVASVFMPLSFLTGLFGMNVGGIPGAQFGHGFLVMCIIMVVLLVVQYLFFKKRHWF